MAQLLLINPALRGAKKMAQRKRRTPAQLRATKKLIAFNKRRNSPAKRKAATRTKTTRSVTSRHARPARVRALASVRKVRRNPSPRKNMVQQALMPAAIETGGALGLDVLMGYASPYLPAALSSGYAKTLVKGAAAIGIGMLAGKFTKATTARDMARGALVVTMHDAARQAIKQAAPQIPFGAYDDDMDLLGMDIYEDFSSPNTAPAVQFNDEPLGVYVDDYSDESLGVYVDDL